MATLIRVDRNGTKYYSGLVTCDRCGGAGGSDAWAYTGWTCYECGGKGKVQGFWKEYTPEYQAKLDAKRQERAAKRQAKAEAEADEKRKAWLERNGFDADGNTYCFLGDTYPIKDELKALGAQYYGALGWHINKGVDGYKMAIINIHDVADATLYGYTLDNTKVKEAIEAQTEKEPASEYIGNVGEKITIEVVLTNITSWETKFGTQYLYSFKDASGNVLVWKTSTGWFKADDDGNVTSIFLNSGDKEIKFNEEFTLTATIKEHSEYKEVKQTVLTRVKAK